MSSAVPLRKENGQASEVEQTFQLQRQEFLKNMYPSLEERLELLGALEAMFVQYHPKVIDALKEDCKCHPHQLTMLVEVFGTLGRIGHVRENLAEWMKPSYRELDADVFGASKAYVLYQPLGVVANVSPWNFPFDLTFGPLVDILAAGNRCMIKPSELSSASSELIEEMVSATFDKSQVAVCTGGPDLAAQFVSQPWDHLIYTGGAEVAKKIMASAAQNLTPLTLELGGKNPTIVTEDSVNEETVHKILGTKTIKNGQLCVTADYALVPHSKLDSFISLITKYISQQLPDFAQGEKVPGIINERHLDRLQGYVADAKKKNAKVVELNKDANPLDRSQCQMPFTLVIEPTDDMMVMQQEVFGPILPIKTYKSIDEAIAFINDKERPLATYLFTKDEAIAEKVMKSTCSGGFAVNSAAFQAAIPSLPFGGVGASGMGCHHGFEGFKNFSHGKGVLEAGEGGITAAFYPPYGELADLVIAAALQPK
ncbi:aldehyde dehydrogenase family protein [Pseudobacteriovorax antillogorgiicola]|uniref:Aldehyde dehydrogenase n=1 Tax=Pseudobacteriovorax antillogorgiicola TaxID=1513793 RepID=A0A1Y6CGB7_9BACT|nr:aldehyde dehydrogenase family protein [Pseudobacteriovorax antillogorgiicola]TCS47613.1 coniferyl-aldehyde dehydrogenase [Pseudobacteriovorax antillogorgiicola]SMF60065.1 coniferyl-aldehyde dehydrogenase [Pseudobacteriovorax antillogorgiicola]